MRITMLKSKLHQATVTDADLSYEGSVSIDTKLIAAAKLRPFERVEIYNINNGARFATYVIEGKDGEICLNGAAARLVQRGDRVIICCYADFDEAEAAQHVPTVVLLDERNRPKAGIPHQGAHAPRPPAAPGLVARATPTETPLSLAEFAIDR
jgi:aspartate 1-decarboxylase